MRKNNNLSYELSKRKECIFLCLAVFILSMIIMTIGAKLRIGAFADTSGDGRLYISVTDNLLDNGHFQQTTRYWRKNMVVPFGLPTLMIPLRMISRTFTPIIIAQFILFGLCAVMAVLSERNLFKTSGLVSLSFFLLASIYRSDGSAVIVAGVEGWYIFMLYSMLYTFSNPHLSEKHKLTLLNFFGFWAMAIRPMLAPLYLIVLCYTIWRAFKKAISIPRICALTIIPAVVLLMFSLINLRESGEWVIFENYASIDMCAVNNPDSTPGEYNIIYMYDYVESNGGMDYARDDTMYKHLFAEYILNYPIKFISDSMVHFYKMYVEHWAFAIIPVTVSAIWLGKRRRKAFLYIYLIFLALALMASTGMLEHRYTVYIIPCWGMLLAGGYSLLKESNFLGLKKPLQNKKA